MNLTCKDCTRISDGHCLVYPMLKINLEIGENFAKQCGCGEPKKTELKQIYTERSLSAFRSRHVHAEKRPTELVSCPVCHKPIKCFLIKENICGPTCGHEHCPWKKTKPPEVSSLKLCSDCRQINYEYST